MKELQPPVLLICPEQKKTALHQLAVGKANPRGFPVPLQSLLLLPRRHQSHHISPCEEVGDLQGQGCPVAILVLDQVPHLVVDADAEAPVDVKLLKQPLHGYQHEVQVVNSRALHHPVHSASHKLGKGKSWTVREHCSQGHGARTGHLPGEICPTQGGWVFLVAWR